MRSNEQEEDESDSLLQAITPEDKEAMLHETRKRAEIIRMTLNILQ